MASESAKSQKSHRITQAFRIIEAYSCLSFQVWECFENSCNLSYNPFSLVPRSSSSFAINVFVASGMRMPCGRLAECGRNFAGLYLVYKREKISQDRR